MCYAAMKAQAQKNDMMGLGFRLEIRTNVFEGITYPMGQMPFGFIEKDGSRLCKDGQFGLVPDWVDEERGGPAYGRKWSTYNAVSEEVFEKPTFREAIKHRRAIIPVQAFLEVADVGLNNFKFKVLRKDQGTIYLAGLWDYNRQYDLLSCSILTSAPMELVKEYHSRSPIMLSPDQIPGWLDPTKKTQAGLKSYLQVSDSSKLIMEREEKNQMTLF